MPNQGSATHSLRFDTVDMPAHESELRADVRAYLAAERLAERLPPPRRTFRFSAEFSRRLGAKGYIGMTWPKAYGGHERSSLERHIVNEELLAAGAPIGAHFVADRQTGPLLLRFGSDQQKETFLPRIARHVDGIEPQRMSCRARVRHVDSQPFITRFRREI